MSDRPLRRSERLVLERLRASPLHRLTTKEFEGVLHRRTLYAATKALAARGFITAHQSLSDTRVRVYRLTLAGRATEAS